MTARMIIDCDPGQDDAVALVLAAHHADLVGITTVGGNAPLSAVTDNALLTCQLFGIEAPVHRGASRPLVAEPRHAPEIHGEQGFHGPSLPPLARTAASVDAIGYLIETIRAEEGLWLVPMGPLTNVALAFRQAPDLPGRLAGVSFMGGSAMGGNRTPTAEFNVFVDPEAAAIVVNSGARIHMAGLDLTTQLAVDDDLVRSISDLPGPGAAVIAGLFSDYLDRIEGLTGRRRGGLHDPCAVLAVTHPDLIESTLRRVDVELTGTHTRGMTVVDQRAKPPGGSKARDGDPALDPNVWHGHRLDQGRARAIVVEAIATRSELGS